MILPKYKRFIIRQLYINDEKIAKKIIWQFEKKEIPNRKNEYEKIPSSAKEKEKKPYLKFHSYHKS